MSRRNENRSPKALKTRHSRNTGQTRIHPELVGMLYSILESGKQHAWLKLRIPGHGNLQQWAHPPRDHPDLVGGHYYRLR